jgi:NADH dehydrogenase [ubiquinone] 1 alpha subcomplex assembly factor 3
MALLNRSFRLFRPYASSTLPRAACLPFVQPYCRNFHSTFRQRQSGPSEWQPTALSNILASDIPPPVVVQSVSTEEGIKLADGLVLKGPAIFLEGKVFLWDVPSLSSAGGSKATTGTQSWSGWNEKYFEIFEVVVPRPEILLLGTGKTIAQPPPSIRQYINQLGIQLDVMDSSNASSTYNLLSEEGRRVAAALLPLVPHTWNKIPRK